MKRRFLLAAAGLLAALFLPHAFADGLTLHQCLDAAYGLSPNLKAARLDIDAAGQEIIHQRTALLPVLSGGITTEVLNGNLVSPFAIATGQDLENGLAGASSGRDVTKETDRITTNAAGRVVRTQSSSTEVQAQSAPSSRRANFAPIGIQHIDLNYALFQNGSILGLNDAPNVAAARAAKRQLEWTKTLDEEKVVFDLCNAFFIAQWYQEKLARDEARVYFSKQRVEIVKLQFELQLKLAQDVELARAELTADEQALSSTRQSVHDSYAVLASLIGQPPGQVAQLERERPRFNTLPPLDALLKQASLRHPAIGVQETVVDIEAEKYRLAVAGLLPSANLSTSYAVGENLAHISSTSTDTPMLYTAGLVVNVPIFDWGSQLAAVRESRLKVGAEQAREEQVKMSVATNLAKLYSAVHDLERQLASGVQARVNAGNAAALARQQRAAGNLDQLSLVEAETAFLNAEDAVENTLLAELEEYAALQNAAGGAWNWVK